MRLAGQDTNKTTIQSERVCIIARHGVLCLWYDKANQDRDNLAAQERIELLKLEQLKMQWELEKLRTCK